MHVVVLLRKFSSTLKTNLPLQEYQENEGKSLIKAHQWPLFKVNEWSIVAIKEWLFVKETSFPIMGTVKMSIWFTLGATGKIFILS